MKTKWWLVLLLFSGCSTTRVVNTPSTVPLQSDLSHATSHIGEAKTLAQRIHDKDVIIDMWNKQHRQ